MTARIVVVRANDVAFLGHIRTCAAAGFEPVSICHTWQGAPTWHSSHSRCFHDPFELPNPAENERGYVDRLVSIGRQLAEECGEVPFCIPSSDTVLEVFLRHRKQLLPNFRLMGSQDWSKYPVEISDKFQCAKLLRRSLPLNVPHTEVVTPTTDIDAFALPVIIKPVRKDYSQSFYRAHGGLKARKLGSRAEALAVLTDCKKDGSLLIQEYIPFSGKYEEIPFYLYADAQSNVRIAATGIKEHLQPAPFGTATVLRLSYHAELLPLAQAVALALRWRGPLMIEFIKDNRDGEWKVIEINTRPWLFHRFYTRHGLDFVGTFLKDLSGDLPVGSSLAFPQSDLVGRSGLKGPIHVDTQRVLTDSFLDGIDGIQRIRTLKKWLNAFDDRITDPYFELGDSGPARSRAIEIAFSLKLDADQVMDELGWVC